MTRQFDMLWYQLEALEERQHELLRDIPTYMAEWFEEWEARTNRVSRLRGALFMSGATALRVLAERLQGISLAGIGETLLSACKDIALVWGASVLLGGAAGGAVGMLAGGVGAVPGATAGAGLGLQASTWVLSMLGLKELIEDLAAAIPKALRHYEQGVRFA